VRRDGEQIETRNVATNTNVRVQIPIPHAGPNIVEIEASPLENELTQVNNRAVVSIDGVRDKLRVLLVSGEPHSGERTWRNLLKSDASVDLVHFTILRPPEKQDGTPINELSLIAFPTRELFVDKLDEFGFGAHGAGLGPEECGSGRRVRYFGNVELVGQSERPVDVA